MYISKSERSIVDSLTLSCIKHNYCIFVTESGYSEANNRMERLFGNMWLSCKELVWQWYDIEYKGVNNAS